MTKRYYKFLILLTLIGLSTMAYSQSTKFQRLIGGSGDDRSYSMMQTKDGGYILTGYTSSFGAGGKDIFLTKTDGLGKVIWSKTYGTSADETGWKVKQTADSGYIVAGTSSSKKGDGIFFKTDANGTIKWGHHFNSDSTLELYNVIESRINGAFYITGFEKTDSFGNDAFVAKYSATGGFLWQRKFGGARDEEAYSLIEELSGNIAIVGVVRDDSVTIGGINGFNNDEDIFIARFDANGKEKWIKNFGSYSNDQAWDIKYLKGEYVLAGWSSSVSIDGDVAVVVIDTSGNLKNSYTISGQGSSKAFSLIVNPDESLTLTGYINTVVNGRESFFINASKSGSAGTFNLFGGASTDGHWPSEVTRTIDGGFTIFTSSNSFKPSSYDLFLIRLDNSGSSECNSSNTPGTNQGLNMQSGSFGLVRQGFSAGTLSLTTNTITGNKDSVLCCKLQAQVAGPSLRVCKGESVRLGKPSIPGYVYKWTAIGGSFTSSESSPLVSPTANTTYKLVVSSSDGLCKKDSANITVSIRVDLQNKDFVRDTFFCAGDSVHVQARSGAINYSWLGSKTNLTGQNVILFQEDVIVLTITDTTTCKYTDTIKVTKKNLPAFSLGNDTTICDNTKITLSGPANMKTYLWNGGQATTRTFVTSEEKTHTLSVVDNFGCKFSDSKVIFNNPAGGPFSLGPDTSICKGINYTIFGWGALTNYFWNGVSTFNPNKVINDAGTFTYQAQNNFGCIHRDTIVITLKPDPQFSLGPDGGVCATGGRTLVGPAGMVKYQWDDGSSNSTYKVFFPAKYWLKVTGTNGCIFTDTIKLVTVNNPVPELGKDTTIEDCDSIYLNPGNFVTYEWNTGDTTPTLKVKKANLYSVKVTDINTCLGEDDKKVLTKACTKAIKYVKVPGLIVQPNPVNSRLNIEWLATGKGAQLLLFDINGKKVFEQKAEPGLGHYNIDVSHWARGIYYLKVTTESASQTLKIVLE